MFLLIFIIYEEVVFSISIFGTFSSIGYVFLFSIPISVVLFLLMSIKRKWNVFCTYFFTIILLIVYIAQFIYYNLFQAIISFYSATNGMIQVLQFTETILDVALNNWYIILFMLLPLFALIVLHIFKVLEFNEIHLKERIISIVIAVISQVVAIVCVLCISSSEMYSNENLYFNVHSPTLTANRFGILTTMRLDLQRLLFGFDGHLNVATNTMLSKDEDSSEYGYNELNINWDNLIKNESDDNIKTIYEYMKNTPATNKNKYTGMFAGKNLVVFVAESFSDVAINKQLTPTLYKLYSEGFQFDNFYTPLFPVSTADGEYMTDTSLIPKEGTWSLRDLSENYVPYSYANVFEKQGYSSQSYHDYNANFYDRDKYLKAMGYDSYLAKGTGLEKRMDLYSLPSSDLDMIDVTTKDYLNNDSSNFVAYYMTISGHLSYTTTGNNIVAKNWDKVKNLKYSDKAKGYLATQIELDKAVELLIERLKEAGELENTVILISGDHYPFGLTIDELNELSSFERDDTFEKHRSTALIWNSEMKSPVKVNKLGSSLDLLPTMLNLFGIEYDSRLLMGTDLLSNSEPLVIYSNRSFITRYGRYSNITLDFIASNEAEQLKNFDSKNYVNEINALIYNKYKISELILENDFYRKLWNALGWEIEK